jgi:hypothetical protein
MMQVRNLQKERMPEPEDGPAFEDDELTLEYVAAVRAISLLGGIGTLGYHDHVRRGPADLDVTEVLGCADLKIGQEQRKRRRSAQQVLGTNPARASDHNQRPSVRL